MKLQLASLAAGLLLLAGCAGPAQPQTPPEASSPPPDVVSSTPAPASEPEVQPDSSGPIPVTVFFQNDADNWIFTRQDYADKAAILLDCGFDAQADSACTYFDEAGRLQMELYVDEDRDVCCGIRYEWPEEGGGDPVPNGFIGDIPNSAQWSPEQPVDIAEGSDGHLISNEVYDEAGRLLYCTSYITHGHLEHYYGYTGDETAPRYYLILDNNMGWSYDPYLSCFPNP